MSVKQALELARSAPTTAGISTQGNASEHPAIDGSEAGAITVAKGGFDALVAELKNALKVLQLASSHRQATDLRQGDSESSMAEGRDFREQIISLERALTQLGHPPEEQVEESQETPSIAMADLAQEVTKESQESPEVGMENIEEELHGFDLQIEKLQQSIMLL